MLIEQRPLDPGALASHPGDRTRPGRTRDRTGPGRCGRSRRAVRRHPVTGRGRRTCADRRSGARGPPSAKSNSTRVLGGSGALASSRRNWPLIPRWASTASPSVSGSQRYLPRRRGTAKTRPARRLSKSEAPGRWRRTGRGCSTWTAEICRPADRGCRGLDERSRPREVQARVRAGGPRLPLERLRTRWPRRSARLPSCCGRHPDRSCADRSCTMASKRLGVVRSGLDDLVRRHAESGHRSGLLQAGLPVEAGTAGGHVGHQRVEQVMHEDAVRRRCRAAGRPHRSRPPSCRPGWRTCPGHRSPLRRGRAGSPRRDPGRGRHRPARGS